MGRTALSILTTSPRERFDERQHEAYRTNVVKIWSEGRLSLDDEIDAVEMKRALKNEGF